MAGQQEVDDTQLIDDRVYQSKSDGTGIQMSEEEHILHEAFNLFDRDGNGTICVSEFYNLLCALGFNPTDSEVSTLVEKLDKNNSGRIEFSEFKDFYKGHKEKHKNETEDIVKAFKVFDKDNNGFIEAKELKLILHRCGQTFISDNQIDDMIAVVDHNGDGKIDYKEFSKYINQSIK